MSSQGRFDNVVLRTRENRCAVSSVCAPFRTAYWAELGAMASELGFANLTARSLESPEAQEIFLSHLAGRLGTAFRPAWVGFRSSPGEIRRRELFRRQYQLVSFLGSCSRDVVMSALELIAGGVRRGGTVDVRFKGWDAAADWTAGRAMVSDACSYLYHSSQHLSNVALFSSLAKFDADLWAFFYERPRVRIAWQAGEFAACRSLEEFNGYARQSVAFKNLQELSALGLWPHVVLPVSAANTPALPELVPALLDETRG
ncbi:MAG: hypothetical protein ABSE70_11525, partial [Candidatus Limnocylindrales bacterium]